MLLALVACSATPKHRIAVATIVSGDRTRVGALALHAVGGLELHPFELPAIPVPPTDDTPALLAAARAAYVDGDFGACREQLTRVDLDKLLLAEHRALAGRTLAFEAACAYGNGELAFAKSLARKLAGMSLELPDAPFAREAETLLTAAITSVGSEPRHALGVAGLPGARLVVDGKPTGCTLPCTVEAPAGDHFVAVHADGYTPAARRVHVREAMTIELEPRPASPALALEQWRARIGRGFAPTDAIGAKLIAQLTGQPRVAYLHGGKRVSGTMIVGGEIKATDERETTVPLLRELAYDAGIVKRPALWQRPTFWIVTSIAVAAVAGAIVYVVYEPEVESNLRF